MNHRLLIGDCATRLRELDDNSVDSVVCDPPYGLAFMGKRWDYDVPKADTWREVLRVLKPGGHLLAFGGTRTFHRVVCEIEDAGFEIRDTVCWLYGQGFPKSLNVSKAIDKAAGAEREVISTRKLTGKARVLRGGNFDGGYEGRELDTEYAVTAPATEAAKQWHGWGTALKPAFEPVVLARKPLSEKNVAANVLKHETGALNIDGSRIEGAPRNPGFVAPTESKRDMMATSNTKLVGYESPTGRFPANVLLDEVAAAALDEQSGTLKSGKGGVRRKPHSGSERIQQLGTQPVGEREELSYADSGGASRFFFVAKASKKDRNSTWDGKQIPPPGNTHATVKPTKLMEYLIKLVTPPGGVVLDPFGGSMSTGVAAIRAGFGFIGVERDDEYGAIAKARLKGAIA